LFLYKFLKTPIFQLSLEIGLPIERTYRCSFTNWSVTGILTGTLFLININYRRWREGFVKITKREKVYCLIHVDPSPWMLWVSKPWIKSVQNRLD
jgi:hypothetical protein